jgi:LysM repeat protein
VVDLDRLREWGPRLLAPVAFFIAATVLILLIQNALSSNEAPANPPTTQSAPTTPTTTLDTGTAPTETRERRRRFYRVKAGDLLETIAAEFNTSPERLLELNPGIDPQALQVGQRLRIR